VTFIQPKFADAENVLMRVSIKEKELTVHLWT